MGNKSFKLRLLERNVGSALGVIHKVIARVEKHICEYEKVKQELEDEMTIAREHHMAVTSAITQNKKVVQNFKNLLG